MYDIAQAGEVPVISPMGNLPVVRDLVVDMEPFWAKYTAVKPYLEPGTTEPTGRQGARDLAGAHERDPQGVALHQLRLLRLGVQRDGVRPGVPRAAGAREGDAVRRRPARRAKVERLKAFGGEHGIWECTRCYFCNERCPKGVDPRDAIAKLGAESIKEGIDPDMGAKHAKWFVTSARTTGWLRETELVPKTQGVVDGDQADEVRARPAQARARCRCRSRRTSPRRERVASLHDLVEDQGRDGYAGIVQGERALAKLAHGDHDGQRDPYGPGAFPKPFVAGEPPEAEQA